MKNLTANFILILNLLVGTVLISAIYILLSGFMTNEVEEIVPVTIDTSLDFDRPPSTIDMGKSLFKNNCASCHNKDMKSKMTGPALAGTEGRWANYPREDLYKWIKNSQEMIMEGHPRAEELWNEWQTVMTSFPDLTEEEIEAILEYVEMPMRGYVSCY